MIKKIFILFILISAFTFNLQAQWLEKYRYVSTNLIEERYNLNIRLYLNGKYKFFHTDFGGPVDISIMYFSGNYIEKDRKLILIDEYTNLQLEYQCIYDTVHLSPDYSNPIRVTITMNPIQTFHFLQTLTLTGNTMMNTDHSGYTPPSHTLSIDKFKQSNKSPKLDIGNYKSTDRNVSLNLNIEKDKQYYLYFSKFLLSSGKWQKKGDKLILQDSILNQKIYGIIGDNRILLDTGYELQYMKE